MSSQNANQYNWKPYSFQDKLNSGSLRYSDKKNQDKIVIAIVSFDIGSQTEKITVYQDDNVKDLAEEFCLRHSLKEECVEYIVQNINKSLTKHCKSPSFGQRNCEFNDQVSTQTPQSLANSDESKKTFNQYIFTEQNQEASQEDISADKDSALTYEYWQKQMKDRNQQKQYNQLSNQQEKSSKQISSPRNNQYQHKPSPSYQKSKNHNSSQEDVFSRLYTIGVQQQKTREQVQQKEHQKLQDQQLSEATFKPFVSPKSQMLAYKKRNIQFGDEQDIGSFLFDQGTKLQEKKKIIQQVQKEQVDQKLTFKPQINEHSRKMVENNMKNRSQTPIYEKLHDVGIQIQKQKEQQAKEEFNKKYPFKPNQSKSPVNKPLSFKQSQDLVKRLMNDQKQNINPENSQLHDPKTGQKLFQPKILKNQLYEQVSQRINIEDQMLAKKLSKDYNVVEKTISKPNNVSHVQKESVDYSKRVVTANSFASFGNSSDAYIPSLSFINYSELAITETFKQLDSDRDGKISSVQIDLSHIEGSMLDIIAEVLYQMEEQQWTLNLSDFRTLCFKFQLDEKMAEAFQENRQEEPNGFYSERTNQKK